MTPNNKTKAKVKKAAKKIKENVTKRRRNTSQSNIRTESMG